MAGMISRFRTSPPRPREERARRREQDARAFWWLHASEEAPADRGAEEGGGEAHGWDMEAQGDTRACGEGAPARGGGAARICRPARVCAHGGEADTSAASTADTSAACMSSTLASSESSPCGAAALLRASLEISADSEEAEEAVEATDEHTEEHTDVHADEQAAEEVESSDTAEALAALLNASAPASVAAVLAGADVEQSLLEAAAHQDVQAADEVDAEAVADVLERSLLDESLRCSISADDSRCDAAMEGRLVDEAEEQHDSPSSSSSPERTCPADARGSGDSHMGGHSDVASIFQSGRVASESVAKVLEESERLLEEWRHRRVQAQRDLAAVTRAAEVARRAAKENSLTPEERAAIEAAAEIPDAIAAAEAMPPAAPALRPHPEPSQLEQMAAPSPSATRHADEADAGKVPQDVTRLVLERVDVDAMVSSARERVAKEAAEALAAAFARHGLAPDGVTRLDKAAAPHDPAEMESAPKGDENTGASGGEVADEGSADVRAETLCCEEGATELLSDAGAEQRSEQGSGAERTDAGVRSRACPPLKPESATPEDRAAACTGADSGGADMCAQPTDGVATTGTPVSPECSSPSFMGRPRHLLPQVTIDPDEPETRRSSSGGESVGGETERALQPALECVTEGLFGEPDAQGAPSGLDAMLSMWASFDGARVSPFPQEQREQGGAEASHSDAPAPTVIPDSQVDGLLQSPGSRTPAPQRDFADAGAVAVDLSQTLSEGGLSSLGEGELRQSRAMQDALADASDPVVAMLVERIQGTERQLAALRSRLAVIDGEK